MLTASDGFRSICDGEGTDRRCTGLIYLSWECTDRELPCTTLKQRQQTGDVASISETGRGMMNNVWSVLETVG